MRSKNQRLLFNTLSLLVFVAVIIALVYRARCGVEFSDEAWYVGDPYIAAKGAVPYTEIWTQAAGTTFPLFVIYKIFLFLNGGTEGIILFSRVLYLVWLTVVALFSFHFCNKRYPMLLFLPLLCFAPHRLFQIDYNTIGPVYLLLSALILFVWEKGTQKKEFIAGCVAGILMARAVIGTPSTVAPCVFVMILLLVKREFPKCLGYCAGGFAFAAIVFIYCSIPYGITGLFYGIKSYLTNGAYLRINKVTFMYGQYPYYLLMLRPMLACAGLCFLCWLVWRKKPFYQKMILLIFLAFLLLGILKAVNKNLDYIPYSWFECPLALLFLKRQKTNGLSITALLFIILYVFHSAINIDGAIMREYFLCYPSILSWWLVFDLLEINISKKHFFAVPITAALCTTILIYFYADVYRDKPVSELKTCVSDGIWKGCIATDQRARDVVLLEKSIRELTNADQTILFMDWASFGYMMTEGKALTPTTLDSILIQYNLNDPQIMFDYYEMKGEIPDVIVWIDYGLISPPSNEDNNRQFNTFLNAYYSFFEEQEIGELKLVVYQLK